MKPTDLKPPEEVTCCVWDYGCFINLAERLGESMKKVYYYSPHEEEYQTLAKTCLATGMKNVERCDEPLHPDILPNIDLFVFPDIAYGGTQAHLRSLGKAVFGSGTVTDIEMYRTEFIKIIKLLKLPMVPSVHLHGLTNLISHLRDKEDKWVKIDRYRGDKETFHHIDHQHAIPTYDDLAHKWGPLKETIDFIVQEPIKADMEVGYDGFCIDGQFPNASYQGYEKKNELYLGSFLKQKELPKEIRLVNNALSPFLARHEYRNFLATEIRILKGVPYFIDPTCRMPGLTGEHQLENVENLDEVIWLGANGILVDPLPAAPIVAEATLHYTEKDHNWKTIHIPPHLKRWFKLYRYCEASCPLALNSTYHFPPANTDEVGVVIGRGPTIEKCLDQLKRNFDAIKQEPLTIEFEDFAFLIKEIKEAEKAGVKFAETKAPKPEIVIKKDTK